MMSLVELQQKYPTALYSYFRLSGLATTFDDFMRDTRKAPTFAYIGTLQGEIITKRITSLKADIAEATDEASQKFLTKRLREKELLQLFHGMHQATDPITERAVNEYVDKQIKLYGPVDRLLFMSILAKLGLNKGASSTPLYEPTYETFTHYKGLLEGAMPELIALLDTLDDSAIQDHVRIKQVFSQALQAIGADEAWTVQTARHGSNIITSKHRRKVLISQHWQPGSVFRCKQLIMHEIGTHVQRGLHCVTEQAADEEGLAIMTEQLLAKRFIHKRAMRYLALGYALGLDNDMPKDFCDTYACMVEAMQRLGKDNEQAQASAFYETTRVFRGGIPSVPGAVYIKDKIYLESNLRLWQTMSKNKLTAANFVKLFRGTSQPTVQGVRHV